MEVIRKKFTCPKCSIIYNTVVPQTITSGICSGCRQKIHIPSYIPEEQYDKWWRSYKWKI